MKVVVWTSTSSPSLEGRHYVSPASAVHRHQLHQLPVLGLAEVGLVDALRRVVEEEEEVVVLCGWNPKFNTRN